MRPDLEGVAADLREVAEYYDSPVHARDLAEKCLLEVVDTDARESVLLGDTIYVPRRVRLSRIHGLIAHELGHFAMQRLGQPDTEESARYLSGAILVPWLEITSQLRTGWNLDALRLLHPNASAEMIARRVTQARDAGLAIYDQGELRVRAGHRGARTKHEREIVKEALRTRAAVRVDDCTGAWPIIDGARERVVVLVSA